MATNRKMPGVGKISRLELAGEAFGHTDERADSPVRACEECGTEKASCEMLNIIVVVGSSGHHSIAPFQHPDEEHWSCSTDCWLKVAQRVIGEMYDILVSIQTPYKKGETVDA